MSTSQEGVKENRDPYRGRIKGTVGYHRGQTLKEILGRRGQLIPDVSYSGIHEGGAYRLLSSIGQKRNQPKPDKNRLNCWRRTR